MNSSNPNLQQTAEQLAHHLAKLFSVSDGRDLVPGLGQGHERSNHEAIRSWVSRKLISLGPTSDADPLAYLIERFASDLVDLFPSESEQLAECVVLRIPEPNRHCFGATRKEARIIPFKPRI